MVKRGAKTNLLDEVVLLLREGKPLPEKYEDHPLTGNWSGYKDCHILPNWLLIYRVDDNAIILTLTRTGSHSDILEK
jgi:mRNA interferase YafQ